MSTYTTELRFICETMAGLTESTGLNNVAQVIENARPQIFDFDYPIFDTSYKGVLETKILRHYYTREICAETVGRWKLFLNDKLNMIMPYYNQLYESAQIEFDPMKDTDYQTEHTTDRDEDRSGNNSTNVTENTENETSDTTQRDVENWELYSDTPQGAISNIENETYLTNATKTTSDDDTTSHGTSSTDRTGETTNQYTDNITSTENYLEKVTGKRSGTGYSELLKQYRETFLNIDKMVVDECEDLFMQIW